MSAANVPASVFACNDGSSVVLLLLSYGFGSGMTSGRPEGEVVRMKKAFACFVLFLALFCVAFDANAEFSTNLQKETTYTGAKKVRTQSFVDRDGNVVMADDLGYATLQNYYSSAGNAKNRLIRTEYYDAEGNPVNNSQGFFSRNIEYTKKSVAGRQKTAR